MRQPWFVKYDERQKEGPAFLNSVILDEAAGIDRGSIAYLVVDGHNPQQAEQIIHYFRESGLPDLYLIPIVCLHRTFIELDKGQKFADSYISHEDFTQQAAEEFVSAFEPINRWIDTITLDNAAADGNIAFRVLRFMVSRGIEFEPITTVKSPAGFVYPLLEPIFNKHDVGVVQSLEYLNQQQLIKGEFYAKSHFCSHCDCAFLNFEETCPDCQSVDLTIDELVHHFKCAYTGELAEFRLGEALVCPKCELQLKHIGVDYDKPSIIYRCNQCANVFQNPDVVSVCFNCGRSTEPENQLLRHIYRYQITSLGQNAAHYGLESLFTSVLDNQIKLTSFNSFGDFYSIETERIRRYKKSASSLVMIRFKGLDELYIRMGVKAKDIFIEISSVFKSVLRRSDVISARNESIFMVIMTETDEQQAKVAVDRLEKGLDSLFEGNIVVKPGLVSRIEVIGVGDDDHMLERFIERELA